MRWCAVRRDRERGAKVVCQDRRATQRNTGRRRAHVVHRNRCDGQTDRGSRRLSAGVGCRVGEGVRTGVSSGGGVGVGAVGSDGDGAVRWSAVGSHRQRGAKVVAQHRPATQCNTCRRCAAVGNRPRGHREIDGCSAVAAGAVGHGVGESIGPGVSSSRGVGVRTV